MDILEVRIEFDGRYGLVDIDRQMLNAHPDKTRFIAEQVAPYVEAMLALDSATRPPPSAALS